MRIYKGGVIGEPQYKIALKEYILSEWANDNYAKRFGL